MHLRLILSPFILLGGSLAAVAENVGDVPKGEIGDPQAMRGVSRHRGRAIPQPKGTEIQRPGQQTGDDANSLNCVATGSEPSKDAEYRVCGTRASKRGGLHPEP